MNASELIDKQIAEFGGWRGELCGRLRNLIHGADPGISEEWKWNTAVWTHAGLVCSAAPFKDHVKLNFFQWASLPDPHGLFNAGQDAKATRAFDFREGESINEAALKGMIRAAVAHNTAQL